MKILCSFLLFGILTSFIPGDNLLSMNGTKQLIVVKTGGWNNTKGILDGYELIDRKWRHVLKGIPVITGTKGLAWGAGLQDGGLNVGKLKKEGDGNAPAGIFKLTGLFGYEDVKAKMSFLKVDDQTFCVDDISSANYNRIVKPDTITKDWSSAETMRLKGDQYKYGIFVGYNTEHPVAGMGSCIFIHIWSGPDTPTSGCTAMTADNILKLIYFLRRSENPLLVQLPSEEYNRLKLRYKLP